jgi:23S rRNA pseudouridine955/2504/2580 synthase
VESFLQVRQQVQHLAITKKSEGQRIDNFLMRELKGVPRSRVYWLIRRGEVRINKKRCKPEVKLILGDIVRIPPYAGNAVKDPGKVTESLKDYLLNNILYESGGLLIVNKPSGLAVHGGSGIKIGLIEAIRQIKLQWSEAELAHRIDRETSGCLVIATDGESLRQMQQQFKAREVQKTYQALVYGNWPELVALVDAPLMREQLESGERLVRVHPEGKESVTRFKVLEKFRDATFIQASPETGRTHQIRVHCQHMGCPILGDSRYSHRAILKQYPALKSIKALCLHAAELRFKSPENGQTVTVAASLGMNLTNALGVLRE